MSWLSDAAKVALGPAVLAGLIRAVLAALLGALVGPEVAALFAS